LTIRLMVVATAANTRRILDRLVNEAADRVEVVLDLGDKEAPFKASSLSRMLPTRGTEGHLMENGRYSGAAEPLFRSDDYFWLRDIFADHMSRMSESYRYRAHPLKSLADHHDYYHVLCDTLAHEIRARDVTHALFFNIPHMGYDTALYHLARALGIDVTIVTPSIFPDLYWSLRDPSDYGAFVSNPEAAPYPIEKGSKPDLFYMKGIKQQREAGGRITARAVAHLVTFLALKRPLQALNPFYVYRLVRHTNRIYGTFPKWRDPFARFFHEDELAYFDHLASFEDQPIDLSGEYVYFPLQLQPEMTTSALGGRFRDQAYAIERLAGILPSGARILVKENPKQGAYMRGPLFFHRLRRIPAVTVLPSWADTHALAAGARAVAAITGTAGWEAIRQGKPALVFGRPWYRKLPGVVEWREDLTYADLVGTTVDHDALQRRTGELLSQAHRGVVERHYAKIVPDYDEAANDARVAQTLLDLIEGRQAPSFG
jgi:hypothetical protein